jgi:hypothetical protein
MAEEDVTVEDLNRALQLFRRILRRILVILILGIAGSIVLNLIGEKINPPFGIHLGGMGVAEWVLVVALIAMIVELYWHGRRIGRLINDPIMKSMPALGLMSVGAVIAQNAAAKGMKPGFFMGQLRPVAKRG